MFQHTAARRRLGKFWVFMLFFSRFQHTAARRRLVRITLPFCTPKSFNTQPPEGGWRFQNAAQAYVRVSTHSRPKAAGFEWGKDSSFIACFNTQPPEGGWLSLNNKLTTTMCFNTQPPEGGWPHEPAEYRQLRFVSTHSRPKAAGVCLTRIIHNAFSFNTQPPEGGWSLSQKPCSIRFRNPNFAKLPRKARTRV